LSKSQKERINTKIIPASLVNGRKLKGKWWFADRTLDYLWCRQQ